MTSMRQLSSAVCEHSIGDTVVKEVAFLEDQACSFSSVLVWDRLGVYADHVCRKMNQRREWNYSSPPKGTSLWPLSSATPHAYRSEGLAGIILTSSINISAGFFLALSTRGCRSLALKESFRLWRLFNSLSSRSRLSVNVFLHHSRTERMTFVWMQ